MIVPSLGQRACYLGLSPLQDIRKSIKLDLNHPFSSNSWKFFWAMYEKLQSEGKIDAQIVKVDINEIMLNIRINFNCLVNDLYSNMYKYKYLYNYCINTSRF